MPRKTIQLDYQRCQPASCPEGVCQAGLVCERGILKQPVPAQLPEIRNRSCLGCGLCLPECPRGALLLF